MGEVVEGDLVGAGRLAERGRLGWTRVAGLSEAGSEQVVVGVGEQQRVLQPGVGDTVSAAAGDAFDEPVGAQAPQVVGHLAGGDVLESFAEEGRGEGAQLTVGESVRQQPVDEQGPQQGVNPGVAEAQSGDAGALAGDDRGGEIGKGLRAADRVVADGLDAEQAPVGGEAELPQVGQAGQPFGYAEVVRVVDGGLGA
jgi:hypothetical protein